LKYNKRHEIVENSFEGILSNQLNCEGCPHKSEKQENFLSIGINIRGKKCLEEALEGFVEGEILDGDNAYFCEICQKKVRTQKRLCIKQLPNILIIVLKRFEFNYDEMKKIKINSYLNFPFEVNMKKYTAEYLSGERDLDEEKYGYSLRGTVIHSGTSEGGHYYSFARAQEKWYSFNDEFIEEINVKKIEEDGYGGEDKSN
jgi:ubiquitin carboxyl-terminal hydrolase 9/24